MEVRANVRCDKVRLQTSSDPASTSDEPASIGWEIQICTISLPPNPAPDDTVGAVLVSPILQAGADDSTAMAPILSPILPAWSCSRNALPLLV